MNIDDCIASLRAELSRMKSLEPNYAQMINGMIQRQGYYYLSLGKLLEKHGKKISVVLHSQSFDTTSEKITPLYHKHDYFELVYIYHGTGVNVFIDGSVTMQEGDALLLNPNVLHFFYTMGSAVALNLIIASSVFNDAMLRLLSDNRLFSTFIVNYMMQINLCKEHLLFPCRGDEQIKSVIEQIVCEYVNKDSFYQDVMHSYLIVLFSHLARFHARFMGIGDDENEKASQVFALLDYIQKNHATLTMPQLEKHFSYSARYIAKLLKKYTGFTFSDLLRNIRLRIAKEYLSTTSLSVGEIAIKIGYSDGMYFSKVFKGKYGLSPSLYRKNL